jgi:hypothetical protein
VVANVGLLVRQCRLEILGHKQAMEVVSLDLPAAEAPQHLCLRPVFDTLGDDNPVPPPVTPWRPWPGGHR